MTKKILALSAIVIAIFLILSGCEKSTKAPASEKAPKKSASAVSPKNQSGSETTGTPKSTAPVGKLSLTVYFADAQSEKLVREIRTVAFTNEVAAAALEQLIAGPAETDHYPTIPKGTKLLGVTIKDKMATVDFSDEFVKNHPGGSSGEIMTIFSVVDTLTEFPAIESVRFLVAGKEIDTIAGHYDLSEPVARDNSLVAAQ